MNRFRRAGDGRLWQVHKNFKPIDLYTKRKFKSKKSII